MSLEIEKALKETEALLGWANFNTTKGKEEATQTLITRAIFRLQKAVNTDEVLAKLYWELKAKPTEGTMSDAIIEHVKACEIVSRFFDITADDVAKAVKNVNT